MAKPYLFGSAARPFPLRPTPHASRLNYERQHHRSAAGLLPDHGAGGVLDLAVQVAPIGPVVSPAVRADGVADTGFCGGEEVIGVLDVDVAARSDIGPGQQLARVLVHGDDHEEDAIAR